MIGSPWNPHFEQSIPGTSKRYDGRRVDSGDLEQLGAWDQIALPQYLEVRPDGLGDPVVMERHFALYGTTGQKLVAANFVDSFGLAAWLNGTATAIVSRAFLWWHWNEKTFLGGLPRVLYYSDPPHEGGRRHFLGFGISHAGVNYPDDSVEPDWNYVASYWEADDVPESMGGNPTLWATVPGSSILEPGEDSGTYPIYKSTEVIFNADIPAGSRWQSPVDLRRPFTLGGHSTDPFGNIAFAPWFRGSR